MYKNIAWGMYITIKKRKRLKEETQRKHFLKKHDENIQHGVPSVGLVDQDFNRILHTRVQICIITRVSILQKHSNRTDIRSSIFAKLSLHVSLTPTDHYSFIPNPSPHPQHNPPTGKEVCPSCSG